jgi:hypothetical protein
VPAFFEVSAVQYVGNREFGPNRYCLGGLPWCWRRCAGRTVGFRVVQLTVGLRNRTGVLLPLLAGAGENNCSSSGRALLLTVGECAGRFKSGLRVVGAG